MPKLPVSVKTFHRPETAGVMFSGKVLWWLSAFHTFFIYSSAASAMFPNCCGSHCWHWDIRLQKSCYFTPQILCTDMHKYYSVCHMQLSLCVSFLLSLSPVAHVLMFMHIQYTHPHTDTHWVISWHSCLLCSNGPAVQMPLWTLLWALSFTFDDSIKNLTFMLCVCVCVCVTGLGVSERV